MTEERAEEVTDLTMEVWRVLARNGQQRPVNAFLALLLNLDKMLDGILAPDNLEQNPPPPGVEEILRQYHKLTSQIIAAATRGL